MKELIELLTSLSLQNILMIGGIVLIILVNIHSSTITVRHPKTVFLFGLLLLIAGISMHAAARLPPSAFDSTPAMLRPFVSKLQQFISKPAAADADKEHVTLHRQEKKKLFGEQFEITAKNIAAAQVEFRIADCAENAGVVYCKEGTYAVDNRHEARYAGQEHSYFISIIQITPSLDAVSIQVRRESQQAALPVQPKG